MSSVVEAKMRASRLKCNVDTGSSESLLPLRVLIESACRPRLIQSIHVESWWPRQSGGNGSKKFASAIGLWLLSFLS